MTGGELGHERPATPVMVQLPFPVGAAPPEGPVTVAVIIIVDPKVGDALAESDIEGVACVTVMILEAAPDAAAM